MDKIYFLGIREKFYDSYFENKVILECFVKVINFYILDENKTLTLDIIKIINIGNSYCKVGDTITIYDILENIKDNIMSENPYSNICDNNSHSMFINIEKYNMLVTNPIKIHLLKKITEYENEIIALNTKISNLKTKCLKFKDNENVYII